MVVAHAEIFDEGRRGVELDGLDAWPASKWYSGVGGAFEDLDGGNLQLHSLPTYV